MAWARLRVLRLGGRFAVALLPVSAVAAFVSGVATGRPYPDLFHGGSLWTRLPFWLQGAFVGSFVVLPLALVSLTLSRSEEHTSELQSQSNLVCRLLLEKKKKPKETHHAHWHIT